jgi:serine/threonine protein kinase
MDQPLVAERPPAEESPLFQELAATLAPHLLLVRLLGAGGMGDVYLARDPALKRLVAVKVLAPRLAIDKTARLRFAREAETMAAMSHPNIVNVYQVGELPRSGTSYFVMQYVDGMNLSEAFPPGSAVAEGKARRCLGEVASALAAAHRLGVVHRDIKPANIMFDPASSRYLVLDFGISAILPSPGNPGHSNTLTGEDLRVGTPRYMSPEQASGQEVSGKSDVYSLGCLAYELLTGEPPFKGTTPMELLAAHLIKEPPRVSIRRPELDRQFAALIDRCLAKSPEARPSAEDLTRAFLPALKSVIEWPPPGLEPLRGLGTRWARMTAQSAFVGALFFIELMMQPTVSRTCCWRSAESSFLWNVLKHFSYVTPIHFDDPDAMSVWYFMLDATFMLLLLQLPLLVVHSWQLCAALRQGARAGYPARTLFDVGWDRHSDTSDLLNGTGHHSVLPQSHGTSVLQARRMQSILLTVAWLLALATPVVWLYGGALLPWSDRDPVVGLPDAFVLWGLPILALLGASIAAARHRRHLPAQAPRQHHVFRVQAVSVIPRELVSLWLQSAGQRPRAVRRRFPSWLLPVVAPALAIAVVLMGATVLSVVFKSTARMVDSAREAGAWVERASRSSAGIPVHPPSIRAALALALGPPAGMERELVGRIDSPSFDLSAFRQPSGCLNPRVMLFGHGAGTSASATIGYGFTGSRGGWRNQLLNSVGLAGVARRAEYCNEALGRDVSTVADSL